MLRAVDRCAAADNSAERGRLQCFLFCCELRNREIFHRETNVPVKDRAARQFRCVRSGPDHGGANGFHSLQKPFFAEKGAAERFAEKHTEITVGEGVSRTVSDQIGHTAGKGQKRRSGNADRLVRDKVSRGKACFFAVYDPFQNGNQQRNHRLQLLRAQLLSDTEIKIRAKDRRKVGERSVRRKLHQPTADIQTARVHEPAAVKQRKVGRAAADIKVQNGALMLLRIFLRAGAFSCQNAFQCRTGGRNHKISRISGECAQHLGGVFLSGCFAGDDDGTGLNILAGKTGSGIFRVYDFTDPLRVDHGVRKQRRKMDFAPIEHILLSDCKMRNGEGGTFVLHGQMRKNKLGGRCADVNAHRQKRTVTHRHWRSSAR